MPRVIRLYTLLHAGARAANESSGLDPATPGAPPDWQRISSDFPRASAVLDAVSYTHLTLPTIAKV